MEKTIITKLKWNSKREKQSERKKKRRKNANIANERMTERESVNKLNNWKSECRIEKNEKTFDDRNLIVNIYNSFDVYVRGTKRVQKHFALFNCVPGRLKVYT